MPKPADPLVRLLQFMHGLAVYTNYEGEDQVASVECNLCSNGDFLFKTVMQGEAVYMDEMLPLFFSHVQVHHPDEILELIG